MKYIIVIILVCFGFAGFTQQTTVSVFLNDKVLTVNLNDTNDSAKTFTIKASQFSDNDLLQVRIQTDSLESNWRRSFFIYNSKGKAVKNFYKISDESYSIKFTDLKKVLTPEKEYFIYSTAIPSDPEQAKLIRVGKNLVCIIKIQ